MHVLDMEDIKDVEMCKPSERICLNGCYLDVFRKYALCKDIYLECTNNSTTIHSCPHKQYWGYNIDTQQCQYKSPHCFDCSGK